MVRVYDSDMAQQQNMDEPSGDLGPQASFEHPERDSASTPKVEGSGGGSFPPVRTAVGTGGPGDAGGVPRVARSYLLKTYCCSRIEKHY